MKAARSLFFICSVIASIGFYVMFIYRSLHADTIPAIEDILAAIFWLLMAQNIDV